MPVRRSQSYIEIVGEVVAVAVGGMAFQRGGPVEVGVEPIGEADVVGSSIVLQSRHAARAESTARLNPAGARSGPW